MYNKLEIIHRGKIMNKLRTYYNKYFGPFGAQQWINNVNKWINNVNK